MPTGVVAVAVPPAITTPAERLERPLVVDHVVLDARRVAAIGP